MKLTKLHIAVLIGLSCGIAFCNGSSEKLAYSAPTKPTGIQVPYKPTWIPLAVASTDTVIEPTPEVPQPTTQNLEIVLTNSTPASSHEDLMAAAGITSDDYGDAEWLISTESSWNQFAVEPTTGACHLEQSNPCGKDGCLGSDAICQLSWANNYIIGRYGNWGNAVAFHLEMGYY